MGSREFLQWRIFEKIEWGQYTPDHYYLAQIAQILTNVHRGEDRKNSPYAIKDLLISIPDESEDDKYLYDYKE